MTDGSTSIDSIEPSLLKLKMGDTTLEKLSGSLLKGSEGDGMELSDVSCCIEQRHVEKDNSNLLLLNDEHRLLDSLFTNDKNNDTLDKNNNCNKSDLNKNNSFDKSWKNISSEANNGTPTTTTTAAIIGAGDNNNANSSLLEDQKQEMEKALQNVGGRENGTEAEREYVIEKRKSYRNEEEGRSNEMEEEGNGGNWIEEKSGEDGVVEKGRETRKEMEGGVLDDNISSWLNIPHSLGEMLLQHGEFPITPIFPSTPRSVNR
ncbi:hypothetical protein Pmani_006231 [Petrolisthes manimaculis]|uniref:Uncharacterized protein n=1 Tax=Petrolisthes manimaculis TaxID=1843537 RepID=A0AAE1QD15_9EUCA|nr:hypothetical protein Pmani_006231 [Petrolisthes manimaculis]